MTMAWCFGDEATALSDSVLERTAAEGASVPSIWPLEVQNVLLVAERRGHVRRAQSARFLEILAALPIQVDQSQADWQSGRISAIAREQKLSAYDAAYIELALRNGKPLATLDKSLKKAARQLGVPLVQS